MSLELTDGFEGAPFLRNGMSATGTVFSVLGRDGTGKGVTCNSQILCPFTNAIPTIIVGLGVKLSGSGWGSTNTNNSIIQLRGDAGATNHLSIKMATDGRVEIKRGAENGTLLQQSTVVLPASVWHYFEVKATIADAGGICIVKVNGSEVVNFTGDTKNGGTATSFSTLSLGPMSGNQYDDLYVLNAAVDGTTIGQNAAYNDFIGERVIKVGRVDGDGAITQWTPNTAVPNYSVVDDDPWSTSDYVTAASAGLTDLYTTTDIVGLASVDSVQVATLALKSDAGARSLRTVTRSAGGTTVESGDLTLATTASAIQGPIRTKDADGTAWNLSKVNSHQYGIKSV